MKINIHSKYGYKVCKLDVKSKTYIDKFYTRSYKQAVYMKKLYYRFNKTKNVKIHIFAIKKKELNVWREVPF